MGNLNEREEMTQTASILKHLEHHGSITGLEALNLYGSFRLAARIKELRDNGHNITSKPFKTPGGARIAKYTLTPEFTLTA